MALTIFWSKRADDNFVIVKQITLFYKISQNKIILLNFFDNRMDPQKKKYCNLTLHSKMMELGNSNSRVSRSVLARVSRFLTAIQLIAVKNRDTLEPKLFPKL